RVLDRIAATRVVAGALVAALCGDGCAGLYGSCRYRGGRDGSGCRFRLSFFFSLLCFRLRLGCSCDGINSLFTRCSRFRFHFLCARRLGWGFRHLCLSLRCRSLCRCRLRLGRGGAGVTCCLAFLGAGCGRTRGFSNDIFIDLGVTCHGVRADHVACVALGFTLLATRAMTFATRTAVLRLGAAFGLVGLHVRLVAFSRLVLFLAISARLTVVIVATTVTSSALTTLTTFATLAAF